jgi:hypothetical protein
MTKLTCSLKVPGIGLLHRNKQPYIYLQNISFKAVTLGSDTLWQRLLIFLEAFLETIFQYLCQCSHHFCSDSFSAYELLFQQNTFLVAETEKVSWWQVHAIWHKLQSHHTMLEKALSDHQWPMCRCYCAEEATCFVPIVSGSYSCFRWYLLSTLSLHTTLSPSSMFSPFAEVACRADCHWHMDITKTFMSLVNLCFLHCRFTICFLKHS